ncbi:tRNA 4-thiouridine(8) synthase ThiI [Aquibacillus koreensis]|uniref:Probable tRNA sulfurtransferase n=1 Tax=Aquibacillus koreensis TaxID=279446 RepID=A0A9X3WIR9_9BACI|nr:tRNA uracil 4-sulfurtransferase ThiI [Aquibacillus koreensis]MCT2534993.1 tRNA 4-thiouridine(8) synthase ThiI [Aquibacillus koreensis]MDC3419280.1 tRNA 4-thiouridine(8) synthase ThiI [Aquibacillus koreensis]
MFYDHIVIRYGELSLKGRNRKLFTTKLHEHVIKKLKPFEGTRVKKLRDRMYIILNGADPEPIIEECRHIFGIQSLSVAIKAENEPDKIKEAALFALQQGKNVSTFKVTTKRVNKDFPIDSQAFNHIVGGHLLSNTDGFTVDVHHPDMEIHIDIRNEATYITSARILGAGGLPVGSSGKTLLLLSGGIDSPVAGYMAMKRGVQLEAIHFHSPPYTSERAKQKVIDLAEVLSEYGNNIKIHVVPFTKLQQKIHREIPHGYSMTVMRRMMMRISDQIARKEGILSLTTGESLGQVASQTMESMHAINEVTNYPIIRPLVAMDKEEIIRISQQINTYDISIRPHEDCCTVFVPKSPKTKPRTEKVIQFEGFNDYAADIAETIENVEVIEIAKSTKDDQDMMELF